MANTYRVELKRSRANDAWIVYQHWPSGTTEGRHFYDDNKQDQNYHSYFKQCCICRPAGYELGDIIIDEQRQMFAEYKPLSERISSNC